MQSRASSLVRAMQMRRSMRREEAAIVTPCDADWSGMTPVEARRRLCAACDKVVHDLSAMSERDARQALRSGPICVRYLHDVHGNIVHGDLGHATIVPASALTAKRWLRGAVIAASAAAAALVFEACGGTDGGFSDPEEPDAGPDAAPEEEPPDARPPHVYPDAGVDADSDASTDPDAGDPLP